MKSSNIIGLNLSLDSDIMDGMIATDLSYVLCALELHVLPKSFVTTNQTSVSG